jgi:hypothetical protein
MVTGLSLFDYWTKSATDAPQTFSETDPIQVTDTRTARR